MSAWRCDFCDGDDDVRLMRRRLVEVLREAMMKPRCGMRWNWQHWQRTCQLYEWRWVAQRRDIASWTEPSRVYRPRNSVRVAASFFIPPSLYLCDSIDIRCAFWFSTSVDRATVTALGVIWWLKKHWGHWVTPCWTCKLL